uniref:NADH-ubiquinone oxidoreductase chain 6 n=1 Tax=Anoplolepis gracilipes TaxID=354296 RepID=A0A346KN60_ANOGC|nr:NADH dehydrogenase subunit 6 [Anoplolepis gracilipes]AXP85351.1 NADH dehydrogenase subunit 6 [Anoplolepis gracilipes]
MNKELLIFTILIFLMFFIILFFLTTNNNSIHPIWMIISILIFSMLICMNLSIWQSNYIYSIMLFLIMISGLLIIFLYFTSLISNDQNKLNNYNFYLLMLFILNWLLLISFMYFNFPWSNLFKNKFNYNDSIMILKFNEMNFQNIINLYEYPYNNMTISSMFYLLISLFTIIKICSIKLFTMRKIN